MGWHPACIQGLTSYRRARLPAALAADGSPLPVVGVTQRCEREHMALAVGAHIATFPPIFAMRHVQERWRRRARRGSVVDVGGLRRPGAGRGTGGSGLVPDPLQSSHLVVTVPAGSTRLFADEQRSGRALVNQQCLPAPRIARRSASEPAHTPQTDQFGAARSHKLIHVMPSPAPSAHRAQHLSLCPPVPLIGGCPAVRH